MTYNIGSGRRLFFLMFYLFRLFYSFLPLHNPIGFGAANFVEIALALLLVGASLAWQKSADGANRLALKTVWCMAILGTLPVVLRLAMLHTSLRSRARWAPTISATCCWATRSPISG